MVAILHNIRSLFNVGSIFRTADGAGAEKLYLCGITPTPFDLFGKLRPQLTKVSLGAEKTVAYEHVAKTATAILRLKKEGYCVVAVELAKGAIRYDKLSVRDINKGKIALVIGHEVRGLPESILKLCDTIMYIPMRGKKESLNVGVAFGIVAYEIAKKKGA